jgi:hypothetical protein
MNITEGPLQLGYNDDGRFIVTELNPEYPCELIVFKDILNQRRGSKMVARRFQSNRQLNPI